MLWRIRVFCSQSTLILFAVSIWQFSSLRKNVFWGSLSLNCFPVGCLLSSSKHSSTWSGWLYDPAPFPHSCPCHNHLSKCFIHYVFIVLNLCTEESGLLTLWMLLSVCLACHFAATDRTFPSHSDIFSRESGFQFLLSVPHPSILHFIFPSFSETYNRLLQGRIKCCNTYNHDKCVISRPGHTLV